MRPARRRSHNSHAHGRTGTRARVLGGATLALVLAGIVSVTLASHATTTWNFSIPSDYAYDQTKIIVESGVAHLRKSFTVTHSVQADFDGVAGNLGNYDSNKTVYNTGAPAAGVKLSAPLTAGTYTSPVIDAGVATTTWKTLSHVRDIQQAAPPATFGAKAVVTTTAGTVQEPSAADLNQDGAVDIVAADINNGGGGKNLYWYKNSGGASPTFTKLAVTTSSTTPAPPVGPGVLAGCGIVGQSGTTLTARHDFADLDNNLTIDIVEPGQTSTTLGLEQYLNPGGTEPQCLDQWSVNSRRPEDLRLANINGDTYGGTDPVKAGRPIMDIVAVDSRIGIGTAASPSGGGFLFPQERNPAPDAPGLRTRSLRCCTLASRDTVADS